MKCETLYEIEALYRDDFRITGYTFGTGEKAVAVIGSMRGNEYQQLFCCSQLVAKLTDLEEKGNIIPGKQILVVPCVNPYSMNIKKRFWSIDNTDINRMFPGYDLGETTQRIADGLFQKIKDFKYGVQFASFYRRGSFVPHIRMMKTGYEDVKKAAEFGLPYVILQNPRPFDTTTLNYNWQIWDTDAFSIYSTNTDKVDKASADQSVEAILNFMSKEGIIRYRAVDNQAPRIIETHEMISIRSESSGFFNPAVKAGAHVSQGELLARIYDPYLGTMRQALFAPCSGTVSFVLDDPMTYEKTNAIQLIEDDV